MKQLNWNNEIYFFDLQTFAKKKGGGSSRNGRDSNPKCLGIKKADGSFVKSGQQIYLQRGTKIHPGKNVKRAKNDTLYAVAEGYVNFSYAKKKRKIVSVLENRLKS